jgi:hypothetical protein
MSGDRARRCHGAREPQLLAARNHWIPKTESIGTVITQLVENQEVVMASALVGQKLLIKQVRLETLR